MAKTGHAQIQLSRTTITKIWILAFCLISSMLFLLFQGGKLALMLFVIMTAITGYLLLGRFSGIAKVRGERKLLNAENGQVIRAGSVVTVKVNVHVPGYLPIPYIIFRDQLASRKSGTLQMMTTFIPDWKRRGEIVYNTPPLKRGLYRFGNMLFSTEDVFGIFEHVGMVASKEMIRVYPQMVDVHDWNQFHLLCKGLHDHTATTRAHRETTQINGVREYVYGDRLSRIHWNATARTGTWKSKEFEREALPKMVIVLDRFRDAYKSPQLFELAVSTAASLIKFGKNKDLSHGLLSVGADTSWFAAKRGEAHYREIMDHFIEVEADGAYPLDKMLQGQPDLFAAGSLLILISPSRDETVLQALHLAERNQMSVCHLWIAPGDAAHREDWSLLLKARGYYGYAVHDLDALPHVLGGKKG